MILIGQKNWQLWNSTYLRICNYVCMNFTYIYEEVCLLWQCVHLRFTKLATAHYVTPVSPFSSLHIASGF